MKLERLTLHNFLSYEALDLDLTGAPIHLFLGPNASGKTTVLDAIRYALLGEARGLTQKKDQWALIRGIEALSPTDRRTASVSVCLRHGEAVVEIVRKRSRTREEWGVNGADPPTFPESATGLSRQALTWLLQPEHLWLTEPKQVEAALSDLLLKGRFGPWAHAILTAHADMPTGWEEAFTALLDRAEAHGFPVVHAELVERRRGLKRQLEALTPTVPETLDLDGEVIHLATVKLASARARLADLEHQHQGLLSQAKAQAKRAVLQQEVATLHEEIQELQRVACDATAYARLQEDTEAAIQRYETAKHALEGRRQAFDRLCGEITALEAQVQAPVVTCPAVECPLRHDAQELGAQHQQALVQLIATRDQEFTDLDTAVGALEGLKQQAAEARTRLDEAVRQQLALQGAQTRLEKLTAALHDLGPLLPAGEDFATQAQAGRRALQRGYRIVGAAEAYHAAMAHGAQRQTLAQELTVVEQCCTWFDPSGPLATKLRIAALDTWVTRMQAQAKALGWTIALDEAGEWRVNGRPRALLSGGEQCWLTLLWQEALAHATAARWLVLDEANLLDEGNRGTLLRWLHGLAEQDYEQILVCAAHQGVVKPPPVPTIQLWHVGNGTVTPVQG